MIAALALLFLQEDPDQIGGMRYEKLATREATLTRMLDLLLPDRVTWGEWHLLTPFPYAGHGRDDLATFLAPEAELAKMEANGPGPDLTATYTGKKGVEARWRSLGQVVNERVDLHVLDDPELNDLASCYLYTTIVAPRAQSLGVHCGSDDGLRFWLDGALLVDHDVPRGLDPDDERLVLALEEGTNHLLFKVCEGGGSWDFQLNSRDEPARGTQALLQYRLDLDFPPSRERDHYRVLSIPAPDDVVLEVGGIAFFSDGTPLVCTRRGELWRVVNAYGTPPLDARLELFASGLHEPLGLAVRSEDGRDVVYCVQRAELTRLHDDDSDGSADRYETFSDGWGISGNYHEYAFGPEFDREGNAWVTLNVGFCGGLGKSIVPWRGWALKITPSGEVIPVCDGLRSPNGIGRFVDGEMFYVDNQGDWVATNKLAHLGPGKWHGHPAGLRWRSDTASPDARPPLEPPAIWFPYKKMGQSAADLALDESGARFGPFGGQFFVGDQTLCSVMRVALESIDGVYQGACFPFLAGLESGVNRVEFAPDGSLFIGETDRGWGSIGSRSWGLQRVVHTGVVPFEIHSIRAKPDGFELLFTADVDATSVTNHDGWRASSYTYEHHSDYGSPELDTRELSITSTTLVDARTVHLVIDGLREGYVHELHASGVRSTDAAGSESLLHEAAYYTLNRIPTE